MAEPPELPEAKDPFEKNVALTIAAIAVFLSLVSTTADHSRTTAIIRTNQASDAWAFYQAKRLKEHLLDTESHLMAVLPTDTRNAEAIAKKIGGNAEEQKRYAKEESDIKKDAEKLSRESEHETNVSKRCDMSELFLQIAIVLCSVAILSHWKGIWLIGLAIALIGVFVGISAFAM